MSRPDPPDSGPEDPDLPPIPRPRPGKKCAACSRPAYPGLKYCHFHAARVVRELGKAGYLAPKPKPFGVPDSMGSMGPYRSAGAKENEHETKGYEDDDRP